MPTTPLHACTMTQVGGSWVADAGVCVCTSLQVFVLRSDLRAAKQGLSVGMQLLAPALLDASEALSGGPWPGFHCC